MPSWAGILSPVRIPIPPLSHFEDPKNYTIEIVTYNTITFSFLELLFIGFVTQEGLEPPHLTASDPKSDASTNSAIGPVRELSPIVTLNCLPATHLN